jgi:hypothetical protein
MVKECISPLDLLEEDVEIDPLVGMEDLKAL